MALLLGDRAESEEGIAVLRSESSVDAEGNILVKLFEYDPKAFRSLRLLVMPMVADPAFRANWSDWIPASDLDRKFLREHDRCLESGLVRSRYAVCGADDGIASGIALSDQPFIVPVPLFNSQPAALPTFTIVPRKGALKAVEGWEWPSQEHSVIINFDAVDSPAAWAARKHGCSLLNETAAERGILASADATCQLLSECPSEELCIKVRAQSLGGRSAADTSLHDFNEGRKPNQTMLLSPEGAVKLLLCLRTRAPDCSEGFERKWLYDPGSRSINLADYALKVPMETLLEHADRLRSFAGLSLLKEIRKNLTQEEARRFDEDAAGAVWQLPEPSSELLSTLATLVQEERQMPKLLAQSLMRSPSPKLPPKSSQLKAAFADLTVLKVNLDDAAQLNHLATLAQLASGLLNLQLFCSSCPALRKVPNQEGLRGLSTHRELRFLRMESFQLQSLPADVFLGLGRLDGLMLQSLSSEWGLLGFRALGVLVW
ncbi:Herc2 [Symbiodinium sp. KB8]|nr:Herc2 [Symbiodinium sp. KB8]